MSVSEFRYAEYSGKVWNEWVELDDELFLFDAGECLCLSILKYFYFIIQFMFQFQFLSLLSSNVSFPDYSLLLFSSNFLSARFLRKSNYVLFTEEKSIIFSWLWAEIISVMGVSSGINIVIVVNNIRLIFWGGIIKFLFILFVPK